MRFLIFVCLGLAAECWIFQKYPKLLDSLLMWCAPRLPWFFVVLAGLVAIIGIIQKLRAKQKATHGEASHE
jgi:hypothetical protein